jgi:hypothetical protein
MVITTQAKTKKEPKTTLRPKTKTPVKKAPVQEVDKTRVLREQVSLLHDTCTTLLKRVETLEELVQDTRELFLKVHGTFKL